VPISRDRRGSLSAHLSQPGANVQNDGKNGTVIEVQTRVANDEAQEKESVSYAYEFLGRLDFLARARTAHRAPSETNFPRETASPVQQSQCW